MKIKLGVFVALAVVIAAAGAADAAVITVLNPSFEDPDFGPSGFGVATDWVSDGTLSGGFQPIIGTQANSVPDGVQVGFAGSFASPGSLFQDLGVAVTPGASYTLDLFVGSRLEGASATYLVELLAGTTTIGSASGAVDPGTGDFFAVTVVATGAGSGNLGIRLSQTSAGGQSLFDDVRLSVGAVPEPASVATLGSGALVLLGSCWRRRTTAA